MSPYVYVGLKEKPKINKKPERMSDVMSIITSFTGIPKSLIVSHNRTELVVYSRHLFCYFSRNYLNLSLPEIARFISRDHTTVIHSLKTIRNWSETEYNVRKDLKDLQGLIENYFQV